jgi:hypothetical protein
MSQNNANQKLNDLLISKNFDPQSLDSQGKPAISPAEADLFSFDYKGNSGQDYGTVVIMLDDENDLNVYFGDNIGKSMESDDKKGWFDFLYQLRMFAKRNLFSFSLQNLNKLKYSMQGQAAINEGLFESWSGTKTQSWNGADTEARLMIKHKRAIGENDARFRYVDSLFVETAEGERYKLPFTKLSAGRAMLEHVRQGGKPYDIRGQHIATIVNEMNLLSRFKRANQGKIFEGETQHLVEQATHYYETLQNNLKSLGSKTGYNKYFETWDPAALTDEDVIIEDLRHMFIEQNIDSRIEQALPLLAKLQREQTMKEANIFEDWTNLILEGTWAIPDTKEKQSALTTLLSQELPVGPDANNATELLYDLLGDDELFDRLEELAEQDANADAREIILNRLEELKNNPSIAQVIGQLKTPDASQEELDEYAGGSEFRREFKNGEWVPVPTPVKETFNTYDMDNTPCPSCYEKELTYHQGSNHVNCGACGQGFNLAGKQIDELNSDTLKSYIKKAGSSSHENSASNLASRAADKFAHALNGDSRDSGHDDDHKSFMRSKGIGRAVDKLEELNPDTLGSYIKKASSDRAMRNFDQGVDTGSTMNQRVPKFDIKNSRKDNQRRSGIHKAVNRLVKEGAMNEVDILLQDIARNNVDIYNIYANPKTNVEKFVSKQIHDKIDEITFETGLHPKDDIDKILQIIYDDIAKDYDVDEGAIGKGLGLIAGELIAPEIPGSGMLGAEIGDTLGDKLSNMISGNNDEVDETASSTVDQMKQVQDEIEKIVRSGGRVGLNDPLSRKLKMLKDKLHKSKEVNENTALTGPYGHSGKLEPVEGTDEDMMARIKFLAGIRETDAPTETQADSNLTTMKSVSSIFLR